MEATNQSKRPSSNEEQYSTREMFRKEAEEIPQDAVVTPDIPMAIYLEEAGETARAAEKYAELLEAVGMPRSLPALLAGYIGAARAAQHIWRTEYVERTVALETVVSEAVAARDEAKVTLALALRDSTEGELQLKGIEVGDTVPQLVAALTTISMIATKFRPELAAVKVDADELAATLTAHAEAVEQGQFSEDSEGVAAAKELRDRYYTLTQKPLADVRAYAQFAFRKEKNSRRRLLFSSAYIRTRNRKQ